MVDYVPIEKGITIRQPSTANLMIDSFDRTGTATAGNFQITRNASILNGFFTRIGTTEVVLEWALPNITANYNQTFKATIGSTEYTYTLPEGFYTVAQCIDNIVLGLNTTTGISGVYTFAISNQGGTYLTCVLFGTSTSQAYVLETNTILIQQLGLRTNLSSASKQFGLVNPVDIRSYRYLDFVSNQLTYAQDLKDSSTQVNTRDVLCRWYLAWTGPPTLDKYGYAILQGYCAFQERRLFSPPKQIRWEPNLPIGNLSFQVFCNTIGAQGATTLLDDTRFNWLMTLQVSEV
jgi:hypothetical protein